MNQAESASWKARLKKLNRQKDFLLRLNEIVPWSEFKPILERIREKPRKLQQLHNISHEELKYQINHRLSWMQF